MMEGELQMGVSWQVTGGLMTEWKQTKSRHGAFQADGQVSPTPVAGKTLASPPNGKKVMERTTDVEDEGRRRCDWRCRPIMRGRQRRLR